MKILVLDDSRAVRVPTMYLLETLGHEVTPASSLEEFNEIYRTGLFDLVLTDLNLPEENAGLELARRLQAQQQKVLLMSSEDLGHIRDVPTITKGFVPEQIQQKLDEIFSPSA